MVATTLDESWGIPVGANVYTADGEHLGSVVEGDSDELVVEKGFFFVHNYQLPLSAVDRYEEGTLVLRLTKEQVLEQHATD